jgi:alkylhydroperoxidase/carboxymuconolactone decarboxylase family protein YurZ
LHDGHDDRRGNLTIKEKRAMSDQEHKNIGITQEQREEIDAIRLEEGERYFRETLFNNPPGMADAVVEHLNSASPLLTKYILQFVTFDMWQRPILDKKSRALVCLAGHTCLGAARQVGSLTKIALNNGTTPDEIQEVLAMMLVETGFPRAWNAMLAASKAIEEWEAGIAVQE